MFLQVHSTRHLQDDLSPVSIMWTKMGPHFGRIWLPNHFVPLISVSSDNDVESAQNEFNSDYATPQTNESNECNESNDFKSNESDMCEVQEIDCDRHDSNHEFKSNDLNSNESDVSDVQENNCDDNESNLELKSNEFKSNESDVSDVEKNNCDGNESYASNESNDQSNNENQNSSTSINESAAEPFHTLPNGKFLSVDDLLNIIHGDFDTVPNVPRGKKNNVFVLVDGEENIKTNLSGKKASYYDDCGVWNGAKSRTCKTNFLLEEIEHGQTTIKFVHVKDGIVSVENKVKGKIVKNPLNPQPDLCNIITLHRYYTVLKGNEHYKKRVSWFENLPLKLQNRKFITIIEYQGENDSSMKAHGNSKTNVNPYKRAHPVTVQLIKESVKHEKPIIAYNKLTKLDDSALFPKDLKQCQYYKGTNENSKTKSKNAADEILHVIRELDGHPFVYEIIHSRDSENPLIFCCSDEQLADLRSFLKSNGGVVGIDRTFLLGRCYVTLLVYKSQKVVRKETGEPPIMLGPLMLHWDGKTKTYFRFFSFLRGILDIDLKNIEMLIGTDDEKAMTNAIDSTFPEAKRRLCTKHIKDNLIRQMTDKIPKNTQERNEIIHKIFGPNGVASADNSAVFDERNELLKTSLEGHEDFLEYYVKYVQQKISEHCVNEQDQLWTNNNTESINHRLKVSTDWKPQKTDELVEKLYDVVRVQHVDIRRALYGTGNYTLSTKFNKFRLAEGVWRSKSDSDKKTYQFKFLNASSKVELPTKIVSKDGAYKIGKTPAVAKKPGQRTRPKVTKTRTQRK